MNLSPRSPNFFFNFERRSWPTQKNINFSPPAFSAPQGARPRPASASTGAPGQGRPCEPSGLLRTAGARQNGWGKATRRGARAQARGHTRGRPDNAEGAPTCRGRVARAPPEAHRAGNRDAPGRARPPDHARNRERPRNMGNALWHFFHFMHMVPKIGKTENESRRLAGTYVLDCLYLRASALLAPTRDR